MKLRDHASGGRAGFTLVEVLLTLLIMSGIMLSMTQILTAARISRDTIHNIQETQLAGPAILDLVERDLRGLVTYDRPRAQYLRVRQRVMLGLDGDSLDFVTTTDSLVLHEERDRFVRTDVNEVGYRLRQSPVSDQFLEIYRREGYGVDEEPFEGGNFQFLHDRVKGFDIQCFDDDGPDAEPIDEWGTERAGEHVGIPARIEITLTLELAPRLVNEQLRIAPIDRRTVAYRRVIRFPESLRVDDEAIAVPKIPEAQKAQGGQGANAANTPGGGSAKGKGTGQKPQSGSMTMGAGKAGLQPH
jgi:prepilin-type N-terminal cleavage/methylation domain-containing protein